MDEVNVKSDVEQCLTGFGHLRSSISMVLAKLGNKSLEQWGLNLKLEVVHDHVKPKAIHHQLMQKAWKSEWPVEDGQRITDKLFEHQHSYLQEMRQRHYHSDLASHLLHKLFEDISSQSSKAVAFTEEYKVDMALVVCGYAVKTFQDMVDVQRKANDPVAYMQREMKGLLLNIFKDEYNQTAREVTAASAICKLLQIP